MECLQGNLHAFATHAEEAIWEYCIQLGIFEVLAC